LSERVCPMPKVFWTIKSTETSLSSKILVNLVLSSNEIPIPDGQLWKNQAEQNKKNAQVGRKQTEVSDILIIRMKRSPILGFSVRKTWEIWVINWPSKLRGGYFFLRPYLCDWSRWSYLPSKATDENQFIIKYW
jgi:hypothetical protein